jgi:hypothetical protein
LDDTARAQSCASIGPSFVSITKFTVAVGTDVMEPRPITHPRIHETPRFSAKIMVVREASRNSTPLCWDLRDEVSVSAEDVADEPRSRRQCEWPGEMLGRDCRSCPRGKTG